MNARLLAAVAVALALAPVPARAYVPLSTEGCAEGQAAAWPPRLLPSGWYLNEAGYSRLPRDVVLATLERAFEAWATPCCSYFRQEYLGTTTDTALEQGSGQHVVQFIESGWPAELGSPRSVIAVTLVRPTTGCELVHSDMVFNAENFTFSTDQTAVDLESIATHEFGHWTGLGHSSAPGSSLHTYYSGGIDERELGADDIDGTCSLYPVPCAACADDADCVAGQRCIGSRCELWRCADDEECPEGRFCSRGGVCEPGCRAATECGFGHLCRDGACVRPAGACPVCEPCVSDSACGDGGRCEAIGGEYRCTAACEADADCAGNAVCRELDVGGATARRCVAPGEASAPACPDDFLCHEDAPGCEGLWEPCSGTGASCPEDTDACVATGRVSHCTCRCSSDADCGDGNRCVEDEASGGRVCFPDWVVDPCARVECPAGERCDDGACVAIDPCDDVACPADQHCAGGTCVWNDPCREVSCGEGQACVEGACVDACLQVTCAGDWVCRLGTCVPPDSCANLVCARGTHCEAGACVRNRRGDDGGCGAAGGPASAAAFGVLAAALLLRRRRG